MTDCSHIAFCIILNGLKISLFECLPKLFWRFQMDTRTLAESYFTAVNKGGWEDFVAENFDYGMCDSEEIRQGRDVYLQGAGQFYALSQHLEVTGRGTRSSSFKSLSSAVTTRKRTRIGCRRIFKI